MSEGAAVGPIVHTHRVTGGFFGNCPACVAPHRSMANVLNDVSEEADRARREFGDQFDLTHLQWFAVLAEEFGEVARDVTTTEVPPVAVYKESSADLRAELLQVAAVACRWIRALDTHQS